MNQILFVNDSKLKNPLFSQNDSKKFDKAKKKLYLIAFIILIIGIFSIIFYIFYHQYNIQLKEKKSDKLMDVYRLSSLYSPTADYSAIQLSNNLSIIGVIEIPHIHISYPILSDANKEALKVSVCRFSRSLA